ncbi:hypothetical protein LguiA_030951 [Lonicera macranthoides]
MILVVKQHLFLSSMLFGSSYPRTPLSLSLSPYIYILHTHICLLSLVRCAAYSHLHIFNAVAVFRKAKMYQDYMKEVPIPTHRGSVIPFTSWTGLAKSLKQLYGQPLHYLTNIRLRQWDQLRAGGEDEYKRLDTMIHPYKAEACIWLMEEVHRLTSSREYLAQLWLADSTHHAFVDPIFPKLQSPS